MSLSDVTAVMSPSPPSLVSPLPPWHVPSPPSLLPVTAAGNSDTATVTPEAVKHATMIVTKFSDDLFWCTVICLCFGHHPPVTAYPTSVLSLPHQPRLYLSAPPQG
ncbi:unnamed protein product [Cuscuta europaea]|uniref:Uncharacterized protein n=1 Tax=Cuscuta europaea TaxID=41803 RepID=A0A9P1EN99_CUSEU|nr:unnamed protein product [Cuscuta europaea]